MARDGLLPPVFAKVHPKFKTPHVTTILTGVVVGGFSAVMSIDEMVDLTNIGTLFAFTLVCIGITILRYKEPNRLRPFKVPLGAWLLPTMGAVSCLFLMYYLPPTSWWRFVAWLMIGLSVYLSYGYAKSVLGRKVGRPETTPGWLMLLALASLLIAIGILAVPHHATFQELAAEISAGNGRTTLAVGSIVIGIVLGFVGSIIGMSKNQTT
jgi:APA family basic amino acid/polyamine antiporter